MRRMRRAGWLVAGIMEAPGKIWRLIKKTFFSTTERTVWSIILMLVGGFGSSWARDAWRDAQDATSEEVLAYTNGNWCVSELLPRRMALEFKDRPMTIRDLKKAKADCIEANEKYTKIERQNEALKKAKAAVGIK